MYASVPIPLLHRSTGRDEGDFVTVPAGGDAFAPDGSASEAVRCCAVVDFVTPLEPELALAASCEFWIVDLDALARGNSRPVPQTTK